MTPFFFNDPAEVAGLFDRNAFAYDRVNSVICLGQDALWRRWAARQAVGAAMRVSAGRPHILDACGGTGLVTRELARRGARVTLVDNSAGMLAVARERLARDGLAADIAQADLTVEAAPGAPFDAATVAFGLRYFPYPAALFAPPGGGAAPGRCPWSSSNLWCRRPAWSRRRPAATSSTWRRASARCWRGAPSSTTSSPPPHATSAARSGMAHVQPRACSPPRGASSCSALW